MVSARRIRKTAAIAVAVVLLSGWSAAQDYKQAYAYYRQGQYEKAIQELKPDLDKNPEWEYGHRLTGLCYLGLKNNALAIAELSRAVQLKSTFFATYYGLAQAYFNTDRLDNCIQSLNQGEQYAKDPADLYNLHHLRGAAHYRQQDYRRAVEDLTSAIRIKQTDWADFSQLGACYYNLERLEEAAQALQKAQALRPGDTFSSGLLGKIYSRQGVAALTAKQYNQAIEALRKAASYAPNDGYVFYNTGEAYLFLDNLAEAERAYHQAVGLLPRSADVLERLGFALEKQKKWAQALSAYQKANEIRPSAGLKDAIARVKGMIKRPAWPFP
jgi:tetratricopeptide (TPR) repeat protein